MTQTIDAILIALGWSSVALGAYDSLRPTEQGWNKIERAVIAQGTVQGQDYARKAVPGALAFYSGAAVSLLGMDSGKYRGKRK